MMSFAKSGFPSSCSNVIGQWRMLAKSADEKSQEKMWISVYFDLSSNCKIQSIMSFLAKILIVSSFTLIFCKIAMQNL